MFYDGGYFTVFFKFTKILTIPDKDRHWYPLNSRVQENNCQIFVDFKWKGNEEFFNRPDYIDFMYTRDLNHNNKNLKSRKYLIIFHK